MIVAKRPGWIKIILIFTVLPCYWSLQVSIPEKEYEIASGGDVTLTCSFTPARPEVTKLVLTWEASPDNENDPLKTVATYFLNTRPDIAPQYEGRASLQIDLDERVSKLTLTKVTIQDSRNYQCSVLIPNDDEGTTAATTSLLVLVPPSAPICEIQGTAEYFHDITLTCESKEGSPAPTYDWKSASVENVPRPFPPKTIKKDGALSLFNISRETSGFFFCTSTNRIGSSSCNLTLAVLPPSMNTGATAGIIGGVVAGLLFLGIVIYCCCRKKNQKDSYSEGTPGEMEFRDKDAPETGEQYLDQKKKGVNQDPESSPAPLKSYNIVQKLDDDQHSYYSDKGRRNDKGSDVDSQHYKDDHNDHYRGSRDRLDDKRDRYGSRDRLEDQRDQYRGSRDRLEDQRDQYRGSRDRLEDQRDRYGGSRDRLEDQRDRYGGSRDRLEDQRDRYGGSRDRLEDQRDRYGGSRDRLEDQRDRYGGSRDRLEDQRDRYGGSHQADYSEHYRSSRDDVSDRGGRYGGSRERLD